MKSKGKMTLFMSFLVHEEYERLTCRIRTWLYNTLSPNHTHTKKDLDLPYQNVFTIPTWEYDRFLEFKIYLSFEDKEKLIPVIIVLDFTCLLTAEQLLKPVSGNCCF